MWLDLTPLWLWGHHSWGQNRSQYRTKAFIIVHISFIYAHNLLSNSPVIGIFYTVKVQRRLKFISSNWRIFIINVLRISPPTLQGLIWSATEISCVRNTTPRRSFEVSRKIFYSPIRGGRPLHGGSATAGGAVPTWGFSRSRLTTSCRVPSCNLNTFGPFSSSR